MRSMRFWKSFYSEMTPNELAPLSWPHLHGRVAGPVNIDSCPPRSSGDEIVHWHRSSWRRQSLSKSVRLYTSPGVDVQGKDADCWLRRQFASLDDADVDFFVASTPKNSTCSFSGIRPVYIIVMASLGWAIISATS